MTTCERIDAVRDYAFGELPGEQRAGLEQHLAACGECAAELNGMRMTLASLRSLPEHEVPQRIAFVSDKVFEASPWTRFFAGFWNSTARLGFASALLLTVAAVAVSRRPVEVRPAPAGAAAAVAAAAPAQDLDAAVARAVARVRAEDSAALRTTLAAVEERHKLEHQALLTAVQENLDVMQKRMGAYTSLASLETRETVGQ